MIEPKQTSSSGLMWVGVLAVFAMIAIGCMSVFAVGLIFGPSRSIARTTLAPDAQVELPTATPRPQVVIAAPDGVDYESAVFMNIYEQVNPSVVNITVFQLGASIHDTGVTGLDPDAFYEASGGSGFVWDADGHIVTNNHVIEGADLLVVKFNDGTMTVANAIGADVDSDLAVLQFDTEGYTLTPVVRGNLAEVRVGQRVAAIGNPFGLEGTLTTGIVSALGRSIPARASFSIPASIQTDAPINPGNSGGPLLNERGEVIGVNAQIRSEERANSGVGFAIPISIVERVIPQLIAEGRYQHPYMGISGSTFSPICADELGIKPHMRGALVVDILSGTPAARAGLRSGDTRVNSQYPQICPERRGGDLLTAVDGQKVTSFDDVLSYLQQTTSPGDTITFTVFRDGESVEIDLTLSARPRR